MAETQVPPLPELSPFEVVELIKINAGYIKHLTTLSTGAVVLQIAFLEKVFPHPKWKAFVVTSLLSFVLSIVAAVVAYTISVGGTSSRPEL